MKNIEGDASMLSKPLPYPPYPILPLVVVIVN